MQGATGPPFESAQNDQFSNSVFPKKRRVKPCRMAAHFSCILLKTSRKSFTDSLNIWKLLLIILIRKLQRASSFALLRIRAKYFLPKLKRNWTDIRDAYETSKTSPSGMKTSLRDAFVYILERKLMTKSELKALYLPRSDRKCGFHIDLDSLDLRISYPLLGQEPNRLDLVTVSGKWPSSRDCQLPALTGYEATFTRRVCYVARIEQDR